VAVGLGKLAETSAVYWRAPMALIRWTEFVSVTTEVTIRDRFLIMRRHSLAKILVRLIMRQVFSIAVFLCLLSATLLFAQFETAEVLGTVRDLPGR